MRLSCSYTYNFKKLLLKTLPALMLAVAFGTLPSLAYSPEKYAAQSALATGNWVKIKVTTTGMQYISNSQLAQMGFKDPSKVNVYGYGGRIIDEILSESMPDDLPRLAVARSANGISFFGTDHIRWSVSNRSGSKLDWMHTQNPYSEDSFYFLSDKEVESYDIPVSDLSPGDSSFGPIITSFNCRQVHEQDIFAPSHTGRKLLGEDFRSPTQRKFTFSLPDNTGELVYVRTAFGHLTSSSSRLSITSNGKMVSGSNPTTLNASTSSSTFMLSTNTERRFSDVGDKLELTLAFTGGGTITMARLDNIEVEYSRKLNLSGNQLHLYDTSTISRQYQVEGCDASTIIWDITDPTNVKNVKYTLAGGKACFAVSGFREFIIFKPGTGYSVSSPQSIANQDIHGLDTPDMVIISPKDFIHAANKVAEMRRRVDGYVVHVLSPQDIYNEFSSGSADPSAIRKMLKMWYDRGEQDGHSIQYCLLMGKPFYDNKKATEAGRAVAYEIIPHWQTETEATEPTSYGTDDFIGMLEDGKSTFALSNGVINVAVGRFPVTSAEEANTAADKLISYVENPILGEWRNNVMIIADDQDNAIHLDQAEDVYSRMRGNGNGRHFTYERLYLDAYPLEYNGLGAIYLQAKEKMMQKFDEGIILVNYIGHANPYSWGHEHLLTWQDILAFNNNKLPMLFGATCEFACWDNDSRSGAETLWLNPKGGYIAVLAATRTVYITNNGYLNNYFSSNFFARDKNGKAKTFGQVMVDAKNSYRNDNNKLRFGYLGDPALRIPSPTLEVTVDNLNGIDLSSVSSASDYPEIKARQKVSVEGSVVNPDGSIADDFNGSLTINLYDAEKPITTYGNGSKGEERTYNDRKTRLYTGAAVVKDGKWTATILMPPELENNYSPARLTLYAYSDSGLEANGSTEKLFTYGYDSTAEPDTKGPEISSFYINREDFTDGSLVGTSAVVMARFSDESGINLSDAGIGHKLSLVLDGKTYLDNVNQYYTPDPFDMESGSIIYPLTDITPGEHTVSLIVWDNANNSSTATLSFNSSVSKAPEICNLSANRSPAKTDVTFTVSTDMPMSEVDCLLEVFDMQGRTVWSHSATEATGIDSGLSIYWNLESKDGGRVDRGIYLYRATVTSPGGAKTTKTARLAVAAP